jgi:membrane-associated protease RseP (regulator of RpoE activity)
VPSPESKNGDEVVLERPPLAWRTNAGLFVATVASVFLTPVITELGMKEHPPVREVLGHGAEFACALLTILVAHEFGHFIAARIHKVDASLPYFIPLPLLSPFGTMGAVIRMRGTIPTRKALLDIGASGPLAGLFFALPVYWWGVTHSKIVPSVGAEGVELGESLLIKLLDHLFAPAIPAGMTLDYSPAAFAAWAGMFVTMINLLPVGQLDGGHVAYALAGRRQDRAALIVHRSMLAFFFVSLASYLLRDARAGMGFYRIGTHVNNSLFWLVWFEMVAVLGVISSRARETRGHADEPEGISIRTRIGATVALAIFAGLGRDHPQPIIWISWFAGLALLIAMETQGGVLKKHTYFDHPPAGHEPLGTVRVIIAVVTLAFFVLLFMPTPIEM